MAEPAPQPAAPPPAHPLRLPHFRNLWIGSGISLLGDQFYLVALPWLVLQLTGSTVALGTVLMTTAVPRAALMLVGGAVIDRFSARRVPDGRTGACRPADQALGDRGGTVCRRASAFSV